ncbi:MAG: ATP-binding protein [Spirochaetes bacterium]|nr:ATP-binding protein [Spirochaetota bacterium]
MTTATVTYSIKSDRTFLKEVRDKVRSFLSDISDEVERNRIVLAIDEALSNIIIHGYEKNNLFGDITIAMQREKNMVVITLTDTAPPFNPLEYYRTLTNNTDTYKESGRGIKTYLTIMSATYRRNNDGTNQLTLFKEIN